MPEKKRTRADFRKNRSVRARRTDWTRGFDQHGFQEEDPAQGERVSGKGELTRKRTVCLSDGETGDDAQADVQVLDVDENACRRGRVLRVHGLASEVRGDDGLTYQCATRRLLKTLTTDLRHVVAAGDRVLFRPVPHTGQQSGPAEGFIERVEPRHGSICRAVRGRQQIIVTNVDLVAIIASAAEPPLKPNLIDRMLVAAEKGGARPLVCINKVDLVDAADLQPLVGVYAQMGYDVLLLSAKTGFGVERFRHALVGCESVVAGQSGVGKTSLLNAIDPALNLRVRPVSPDTEKGCHTTTTAQLLPLVCGGYVVDTPGIRQFELWDVIAEEVAGYFRDLRPYESLCRFPDCTHTHEDDCAVKNAVADGRLDERRYESYCRLIEGDAN